MCFFIGLKVCDDCLVFVYGALEQARTLDGEEEGADQDYCKEDGH